jgi:hypothetical protein
MTELLSLLSRSNQLSHQHRYNVSFLLGSERETACRAEAGAESEEKPPERDVSFGPSRDGFFNRCPSSGKEPRQN